MGLFDKIKNMFTEEEYEEEKEPIKKEVFQVEIPAPKIEEKKEEVKVKEEPKKEEKFVFPVYFDDSDFEEELPKKVPEKPHNQPTYSSSIKTTREERYPQPIQKKEEVRKRFKRSPVISPVYGVLDKNYKKEDIIEKKRESEDYFGYKGDTALRVDKVRKKAFGTLEDELESTLNRVDVENYGDVEQAVTVETKEKLEKEATTTAELEDMFFDSDMTLEDAINKYDNKKESTNSEESSDLIESDLFNLIDSMYDKDIKEEEWQIHY